MIGVFWRESSPRSPISGGDFENPEGPPDCPRDFQNPRRAEGIVGEDYRTKNPNLMHIFFNITNEIYMKNVLGSKIFGGKENFWR